MGGRSPGVTLNVSPEAIDRLTTPRLMYLWRGESARCLRGVSLRVNAPLPPPIWSAVTCHGFPARDLSRALHPKRAGTMRGLPAVAAARPPAPKGPEITAQRSGTAPPWVSSAGETAPERAGECPLCREA